MVSERGLSSQIFWRVDGEAYWTEPPLLRERGLSSRIFWGVDMMAKFAVSDETSRDDEQKDTYWTEPPK